MSTPKVADPVIAPERSVASTPTKDAVTAQGTRASDQARSAAGTVLTSGSGVTSSASTAKKTLLGE